MDLAFDIRLVTLVNENNVSLTCYEGVFVGDICTNSRYFLCSIITVKQTVEFGVLLEVLFE